MSDYSCYNTINKGILYMNNLVSALNQLVDLYFQTPAYFKCYTLLMKKRRWKSKCCHGSERGKQEGINREKGRKMLTSMCGSAATSAIVLYACLYACAWGGGCWVLSGYVEVSRLYVCVCVCVHLLSEHLSDIKALCKLSPWQLFRIPSPLSV